MTDPDLGPGLGPARVRELLADAAEQVAPADRLGAIRAATQAAGVRRRRRRTCWAAGSAALVGATAVAAVAGAGVLGERLDRGDGPVTASDPAAPSTSATPTGTASAPVDGVTEPVYQLGDTPAGPRLFREFHRVPSGERVLRSLQTAIAGDAQDPDYRSPWPAGARVVGYHFDGSGDAGTHQVVFADDRVLARPRGMSEQEARLGVQQLVYTAQGSTSTRAGVSFFVADGSGRSREPVSRLLGVPVGPVTGADPMTGTVSPVLLSDPSEGLVNDAGTLVVRGATTGVDGTVRVDLLDGARVVDGRSVPATAAPDRLVPFRVGFDTADLPAGSYTVRATVDAGEGRAAVEDTREVELR